MSTYYTAGDYWATVTKQAMGKTSKGNPQFVLSFTVLGQVDPSDDTGYITADNQYERTMFRVITDGTVKYACEDLEQLGIEIASWGQLDPSHASHVSVVGTSHKFRCAHESYEGKMNEKWSLARGGSGVKVEPMNDQELRKLDAMFGKSLKSTSVKPAASKVSPKAPLDDPNSMMQETANSHAGDDIPF